MSLTEKAAAEPAAPPKEAPKREAGRAKKSRVCSLGLGYFVSRQEDVEKSAAGPSVRPTRLLAPFYCGLACAFSFCACAAAVLSCARRADAAQTLSAAGPAS